MSLPTFPDKDNMPTREEAVNQIISSIAMEELGLSHIINAEGEKLQYALGTIPGIPGPQQPLTMEELLKLNDSVRKTLDSAMMNQFFLKEKLMNALSASVMQGPPGPEGPQGPATIDVDPDTQTLDPGTPAYVENTGSIEHAMLRFGIPKGEVGVIMGTYATLQALIDDHPQGGTPGDTFLVGEGDLYVWNADTAAWTLVGNLRGPAGPSLETGSALFTISGTSGAPKTLGYEESLQFESDTLNITVDPGLKVQIENPKAHVGAIIPFYSGGTLNITTTATGGNRYYAGIIGCGGGDTFTVPSDVSMPITLVSAATADNHFVFPMPEGGTLTAMTASLSAYPLTGLADVLSRITAQLYYSPDNNNTFLPLEGASVVIEIDGGVQSVPVFRTETKTGLSIPLAAGTRILMLFYHETPEYTSLTVGMTAHYSASLKIL